MKKSYADMDPLEEVRAIKEEISREFKTVHAYGEYLREKYPNASVFTESKYDGSRTVLNSAKSRTAKTNKKVAGRRKTAQRLVHA
jgi:hypothetical protein